MRLYGRTLFEEAELLRVSKVVRRDYIQKASVWHPTDVSQMNLWLGPQESLPLMPGQEVRCRYVEPHGASGGHTPKFKCKLQSGQIVRVKYSSRETFAEVAGTRLLWALGFYTDYDYPVQLLCEGCPEKDPFHPSDDERRLERLFRDTVLEPDFPGQEIGVYHDQGWAWSELDLIDETAGGSSKAQVDALKLLAVFLQHNDSKQSQQRLACFAGDLHRRLADFECVRPVMMIQDLGATFGGGGPEVTAASAMSLADWKKQPIWNHEKEMKLATDNPQIAVCVGKLTGANFAASDGLFDPVISEAGRSFLAKLLSELSDRQIGDLFRAARIDKTGEMIEEQGQKRPVNAGDWVAVFKTKRQEIINRHCR
jgi:hypothetical protein